VAPDQDEDMVDKPRSGWGGRRSGAGRKKGIRNRTEEEIAKAKAQRAADRAAKAAAESHCQKPVAMEEGAVEILPPLHDVPVPLDVEPLDFLKHLMRNETLPLGFRRDCAALALPYAHAKPAMLGIKDQRDRDAQDDYDDPMASAFRV
jgi:hypothetical protein